MSDRAKYVMIEKLLYGYPTKVPYLFPDVIIHADFIRQMGVQPKRVVGAGFVQFGATSNGHPTVTAFGTSTSLGVDSAEGDSDLIAKALGFPNA